jgi:hypothetical protein
VLRLAFSCIIVIAACVHDDLVTCGDQLCPAGSLCDAVTGTCADLSGLSVPTDVIDLQVPCGATATSTVPFRNIGADSISFAIASTVEGIAASPESATLAPGAELDVQLVATAPSESIPGLPVIGNLLIAVNGNQQTLGRPLQLTTRGSVIATSAQTLDFGESSVPATSFVRTFSITNTGNEDVQLLPSNPTGPYSLTSPNSVDLAPEATQTIGVAFQPLDGSFDSSVDFEFSPANTCQPPPSSIALSGVGTGAAILVDHLVLDFGTGTCGDAAVVLPLTFTNNNAAAQPLAFSLTNNPGFTFLTDPAPTLAAGPSTTTIHVTRNLLSPPHGPGPIAATLSIMAPALTGPTLVTLKQQILAPQVTLSMSMINYNPLPEFGGAQTAVQIVNTGNAVANVTVSPAFTTFGTTSVSFTPSSFQIPPGGGTFGTVTVGAGNAPVAQTSAFFQFTAAGTCTGSQFLSVSFSVL